MVRSKEHTGFQHSKNLGADYLNPGERVALGTGNVTDADYVLELCVHAVDANPDKDRNAFVVNRICVGFVDLQEPLTPSENSRFESVEVTAFQRPESVDVVAGILPRPEVVHCGPGCANGIMFGSSVDKGNLYCGHACVAEFCGDARGRNFVLGPDAPIFLN